MTRRHQTTSTEKQLPSIANRGYFSDYFLGYRLDAGLDGLYKQWDETEKRGDPTPRTRVRSLSTAFDKHRANAAATAPDLADNDTRLHLGALHPDDAASLIDLNDAVLDALGWSPARGEPVELTSGNKTVHVPAAHRCETASGLLLLALDAVFATDPATVVANKAAATGTLLRPVRLGEKENGRTALEAAQLIFTADKPPAYLLICSGAAITLLDRDRWGEGVYIGANLDDAIARADTRAKGELAAIAALFGADSINPEGNAESVLAGLVARAANESAGVSKDLRYGIRRSVELLAKAFVSDIRHRQKGAWQNLDPSDITRQCLRYLYRIIVLLYAEARPELGILPVDDPDYQDGYSLARLRDASLVQLHSEQAHGATHIQQSLDILFKLVNDGYEPDATLDLDSRDLGFPGLDSQLFSRDACPLLDRARIDDHTLQQVLAHLCFSRERHGRDRQSLSYATLGINQLGAVYEGLMAYRGILAPDALYEIDNDDDPDTGTWVVPVGRADEFDDEFFVKEEGPDGQPRRVRYEQGDFVFRLAGRDRQRSASYYSPEVLTEFTVRHTLDTYWNEHPGLMSLDILRITFAEPALGSGAFLNEAINQLAARYLKAAQDERDEIIDPDQYPLELAARQGPLRDQPGLRRGPEPDSRRTRRSQPVAQLHAPRADCTELRRSPSPRQQPHRLPTSRIHPRPDQEPSVDVLRHQARKTADRAPALETPVQRDGWHPPLPGTRRGMGSSSRRHRAQGQRRQTTRAGPSQGLGRGCQGVAKGDPGPPHRCADQSFEGAGTPGRVGVGDRRPRRCPASARTPAPDPPVGR